MNKIHPVKSALEAEKMLAHLGLDWEIVATPRLGEKRDHIANQNRETYGGASHYINAKFFAVASLVQETNALVVYERPRPVPVIAFKTMNVRRRNGNRFRLAVHTTPNGGGTGIAEEPTRNTDSRIQETGGSPTS